MVINQELRSDQTFIDENDVKCTGAQHFLQDCACALRRLGSACAFAQSNQSLHRAHRR